MFLWFFAAAFIAVMIIKSSMNYEFGSDRKKLTARLSVFAATLVAVIIHLFVAGFAIAFLWPDFPWEDRLADWVMSFLTILSGILIWGFIVPKVVFPFIGTLHLPKRWPWETQFSRALARLRALPFPA